MATARYATTTRRRPWSRARKIGTAVAALLAAGALVAVAALLVRAPLTGSATVHASPGVSWVDDGSLMVTNTSGTIKCSPALVSSDELAVTISDALADSWCEVRASIIAESGVEEIVVQSISFGAGVDAAFAQASGVSVACGKSIPSNGTPLPIVMRFTIPAGTEPGTYPADASAGLVAVDANNYVSSDCPTA